MHGRLCKPDRPPKQLMIETDTRQRPPGSSTTAPADCTVLMVRDHMVDTEHDDSIENDSCSIEKTLPVFTNKCDFRNEIEAIQIVHRHRTAYSIPFLLCFSTLLGT